MSESWAWASGFFDGEGHVSFILFHSKQTGRTRFRIHMAITQKDPEVLKKWLSIVKLGNVYGPYYQTKRSGFISEFYTWRLSGYSNVHRVATNLWPNLGKVKKQQFNLAIRKYREFRNLRN